MSLIPDTPGVRPRQLPNQPVVVVWLNPDAAAFMRANLSRSQMTKVMALAGYIAENGPVHLRDVRQIIGVAARKHGLPIRQLPSLFVVSKGLVDLNDYAFVPEYVEGGKA